MVINFTKTTIKSTVRPLGGNLFEGKIKKYFYKEIIKEKFWSLRTDGRVEKNARKTSVLWGGSTVVSIAFGSICLMWNIKVNFIISRNLVGILGRGMISARREVRAVEMCNKYF